MKRTWLALSLGALVATGCGGDNENLHISSIPAQLTQYDTCSALHNDLRLMLKKDVLARYEQIKDGGYFGGGVEDAGTAEPAPGSDQNSDGRTEGEDFSGTNNQEEGVDEADFVKTDGYHTYVLNGNRLHIFGIPEFGDLVPESVTEIEGMPRQMLINRDAEKVVVFSVIYPWTLPEGHPLFELMGEPMQFDGWMWRVNSLSKLTVIDISDHENPELVREVFIEGQYQTARMVDGSIRVGSYAVIDVPGHYGWDWYWGDDQTLEQARNTALAAIDNADLEDMVPRFHERLPSGQLITHGLTTKSCRGFYRPGDSTGRGFTSLISMDLFSDNLSFEGDHVVSNWATIYASKDNFYIAENANDWWWFWFAQDAEEATNIHRFDIRTPGKAYYKGSGRVPGWLNNQFSLSEYDGHLRVASTTNPWQRWWDEEAPVAENHVYVLKLMSDKLRKVGHVGGIAPEERIFASRFVGDKGYLITFRQVDPLWTLDLSDHKDPKVVGELEIPGFSSYLHPLGDDHLLGIGVGGDENGVNWATQISLFDVSDFANPKRDHTLDLALEGGWAWSEAQWDHKAFQYWGPEKLLAIPVSTYNYDEGGYSYISKLELVSVDPEAGLASYGSVDHSDFFNSDPDHYWDWRDIRRSIFMGDYVYAISERGITVHTLDGLTTVNSEALPGNTGEYYWWW